MAMRLETEERQYAGDTKNLKKLLYFDYGSGFYEPMNENVINLRIFNEYNYYTLITPK